MSRSRMRTSCGRCRERGRSTNPFEGFDPDDPPRFMVADEAIAAEVDGTAYADAKIAAMQAHATQIAVDGPFFALSNSLGNHVWGSSTTGSPRAPRVRSTTAGGRPTSSRVYDGRGPLPSVAWPVTD